MKKLSFWTICIILLLFLFQSITVNAKIVDKIIAYVNDDIITQHELDKVVSERTLELQQIYQFSPKEAKRRAEQERLELLDKMIRKMLLVQEALKRNIQITDAEVEQRISELKERTGIQSNEEFRRQLEAEGLTMVSFREQTKKNLMSERLSLLAILPKINVTESEVMEFFDENKEEFTSKADRVRLSHIFIESSDQNISKGIHQKIEKIMNELDSGADFAQLSQKYSDDLETGSQGGDLGFKSVAELQPEVRDEIQSLKKGEYTKPIETELGIHIFKLSERKVPELTQQEKEQIKEHLRQVKFQREWDEYTDSLKEEAFIDIRLD